LVINVLPPIGFAPIGINKIYHAKGELPIAKVASEFRLPYGLSTAGSTAIEDVATSNDEGAKLPLAAKVEGADDELTVSLLTRAHESGFTACILTTDTWQLGRRHDDTSKLATMPSIVALVPIWD
jgi:isopentenyl diphosphate isomerase/L-lactate dehydrogenase-like FMN-dependent dehydrogenase